MRKALLFGAILFALALFGISTNSSAGVAAANSKQRAVVNFRQPMQLLNVTLKGEYLFVHDDTAMARGEACTYVYEGLVEQPSKLVTSFHCVPMPRPKTKKFVIRSKELSTGIVELREFQFAGSTEAHEVPITIH